MTAGNADQTTSTEALAEGEYNASVVRIVCRRAGLLVMRVQPDEPMPSFRAGQYTVLGLGSWEPVYAGVPPETPFNPPHVIKRAYSVSCPLIDDSGALCCVNDLPWFEFLIALVPGSKPSQPALTPRLFALEPDARLFCGLHLTGRYVCDELPSDKNVVFLGTGTGEAPHNAMIAELLSRGHTGRITNVTCARYRSDLAYERAHRQLEEQYQHYRYLAMTTREPENVDRDRPGFVGRRYIQDLFLSGELEQFAGHPFEPATTHLFLCGSPEMIGAPKQGLAGHTTPASPRGMVGLLQQRGFTIDSVRRPGTIHFELYW
jgi:ferredoxin--NADP+ reductase